jgi:type II secretion system protein C
VYFRIPQQYATILNLFLISLVAYFLALAVGNGVKLHLASREVAGVSDSPGQLRLRRPQAGPRPRAYYNTIVQRDIFSRAPVATAAAPVQDENLDITLVGTSHLSGGKPFIIVETSDGEQSLYRLGDTIHNVGRVVSIGHNQAIVLHNGHRVAIRIPNVEDGNTPAPVPFGLRRRRFQPYLRRLPGSPYGPYGSPQSQVQRLSSNRYVIGRVAVDRGLSNMGSLFTQIRALPNLQNGSSKGFRLSQIHPGSIFQQIGLEDGDVVTGAQGQQVNDPIRAMMLLNALRNSQSITLNLIRNGSPLQLHYTIH